LGNDTGQLSEEAVGDGAVATVGIGGRRCRKAQAGGRRGVATDGVFWAGASAMTPGSAYRELHGLSPRAHPEGRAFRRTLSASPISLDFMMRNDNLANLKMIYASSTEVGPWPGTIDRLGR
jgi:hypothetical protein